MKAHDVRHLCICPGCNDLIDDRKAVDIEAGHWHPKCAYRHLGRGIFKLPASERGKFSLSSVGIANMRRLMKMAEAETS